MAVLQVMLGAYRGAGNTKTAMAFSMVTLWLGRVPTVYYLAFVGGFGATGIWIGMALGNVLGAIAAALWFTRGTWKETVIDDEEEAEQETAGTPDAPVSDPDLSGADPDLSDTSASEGK
jgi:Na+-driven multidrug efflux pump